MILLVIVLSIITILFLLLRQQANKALLKYSTHVNRRRRRNRGFIHRISDEQVAQELQGILSPLPQQQQHIKFD
jgi:hypothetical protein